jgi:hypothetical protein
MNKLPVFRTVGQTFGFVVERRFFALLRLIWLPAFLSVVISVFPAAYQFSVAGFPPDPVKMDMVHADPVWWVLNLVSMVFSLIFGAMIAISVHRIILLDDSQPGVYFYWRLTRDEVLYILAGIGYGILVGLAFALPLAAHFYYIASYEGGIAAAAKLADGEALERLASDPRLAIAAVLSLVFGLGALARFGLVFPIIVAEGKLSFWRSWVVTRGNVLRLILFWIVVVVLAYVLILLTVAVLGLAVAGMVAAVIAGGKEVGALGILVFSVPAAVSLMIYLVVGITLFIAAMSFSYKALAGDPVHADTFS